MLSVLLSSLTTTGPAWAIIGPMDQASSGAFDLLLKSLEELDSARYRFALWAKDIAFVPSTVLSRCLERYIPATYEDLLWEDAMSLYDAWVSADLATVSKLTETVDLLPSFVHVLASQGSNLDLNFWGRLRRAMQDRTFDADEFFTLLAGARFPG